LRSHRAAVLEPAVRFVFGDTDIARVMLIADERGIVFVSASLALCYVQFSYV
jgi:hypothetical protein